MPYLQITTVCNMTCAHCCFDCSPVGEHMPYDVWKRILEISPVYVTIGGGEPTCHPHFWDMLYEALDAGKQVWMTTNGKRTDDALRLAEEVHHRKNKLTVLLSQDQYHEHVDMEVIEAFDQKSFDVDIERNQVALIRNKYIGINGAGNKSLVRTGRSERGDETKCICPTNMVKPNGDVHECGCIGAKRLGSVMLTMPKFIPLPGEFDEMPDINLTYERPIDYLGGASCSFGLETTFKSKEEKHI